jgi:hypothetical protein
MKGLSSLDMCLLWALRPAAKQHDQAVAIPGEMDPIVRTPIDDIVADTRKPLHVRCVAQFHAQLGRNDFRRRLGIQAVEPVRIRACPIRANVFLGPNMRGVIVTYTLLKSRTRIAETRPLPTVHGHRSCDRTQLILLSFHDSGDRPSRSGIWPQLPWLSAAQRSAIESYPMRTPVLKSGVMYNARDRQTFAR